MNRISSISYISTQMSLPQRNMEGNKRNQNKQKNNNSNSSLSFKDILELKMQKNDYLKK